MTADPPRPDERPRRRVRRSPADRRSPTAPGPVDSGGATEPSGTTPPAADRRIQGDRRRPPERRPTDQRDHGDRGWRELTGSAPSQVGTSGAMRARDIARPTAEDLDEAEREVVIVRRQWHPPEGG